MNKGFRARDAASSGIRFRRTAQKTDGDGEIGVRRALAKRPFARKRRLTFAFKTIRTENAAKTFSAVVCRSIFEQLFERVGEDFVERRVGA